MSNSPDQAPTGSDSPATGGSTISTGSDSPPQSAAASKPDSHATTPNNPAEAAQGTTQDQPQKAQPQEPGNVPSHATAAAGGSETLAKEWPQITLARGPDGKLYNPAKGKPPPREPAQKVPMAYPSQQVAIANPSPNSDLQQNSGIIGLDEIPKSWGELPGNVSLSLEIGWVQANRLYVVKEQAGKPTRVDLSKARAPAPSAAALSWLETSIRSYAKFVEVAAKTASAGTEDQEEDRQERMQIEEIRTLLKQMID